MTVNRKRFAPRLQPPNSRHFSAMILTSSVVLERISGKPKHDVYGDRVAVSVVFRRAIYAAFPQRATPDIKYQLCIFADTVGTDPVFCIVQGLFKLIEDFVQFAFFDDHRWA